MKKTLISISILIGLFFGGFSQAITKEQIKNEMKPILAEAYRILAILDEQNELYGIYSTAGLTELIEQVRSQLNIIYNQVY